MNLHNIAPATKTVPLGSGAVEVTGLSLRKLTSLIVDYPDLVALAAGGRVDLAGLIERSPNAALAIFQLGAVSSARRRWWWGWWRAASVLDDAEMLKAFDQAPAGQQVGVLAAIVDLTFKGGERAAPFLKSLADAIVAKREPAPETSSEPTPPSSSD